MRGPVDKTTLYLDAADYRALKGIARRRGKAPAELVREAVADYVVRHGGAGLPRSLGLGRSGAGDLSEKAEELLTGMGAEPEPRPARPGHPPRRPRRPTPRRT